MPEVACPAGDQIEYKSVCCETLTLFLTWLSVQQAMSDIEDNLQNVKSLLDHPAFIPTNPNCNYSLLGAFASSPVNFHKIDGSGYSFLAEELAKVITCCHKLISAELHWIKHKRGSMTVCTVDSWIRGIPWWPHVYLLTSRRGGNWIERDNRSSRQFFRSCWMLGIFQKTLLKS